MNKSYTERFQDFFDDFDEKMGSALLPTLLLGVIPPLLFMDGINAARYGLISLMGFSVLILVMQNVLLSKHGLVLNKLTRPMFAGAAKLSLKKRTPLLRWLLAVLSTIGIISLWGSFNY